MILKSLISAEGRPIKTDDPEVFGELQKFNVDRVESKRNGGTLKKAGGEVKGRKYKAL